MQRTTLAGTSLEVSRLGFGTASLHHLIREKDRARLLCSALDCGFTHFDAARMYGEGMAERSLGRFIKGWRDQVTLATKFGLPAFRAFEALPALIYAHRAFGKVGRRLLPNLWDRRPRLITPEAAEQSLVRSLKALQTDWIDLLLLHEPEASDRAFLPRLAQWLQQQKGKGRVRYVGLAGTAARCVEAAQCLPDVLDILQVEDSIAAHEADLVSASGRPLQITFAYLRQAGTRSESEALQVIKAALERNREGMVLVSTRRPERLPALAAMAADAR
ncbi:aldo/keto reductase [Halochromatium sp.]